MPFFPSLLFVFIFCFFAVCLFTIIKFYSPFFSEGRRVIVVCANDDGIKSFSYSTAKYCKFSPRQQLAPKTPRLTKKNTLRWIYSGNVIHKIYLAHLIVKLNSGVFFSAWNCGFWWHFYWKQMSSAAWIPLENVTIICDINSARFLYHKHIGLP